MDPFGQVDHYADPVTVAFRDDEGRLAPPETFYDSVEPRTDVKRSRRPPLQSERPSHSRSRSRADSDAGFPGLLRRQASHRQSYVGGGGPGGGASALLSCLPPSKDEVAAFVRKNELRSKRLVDGPLLPRAGYSCRALDDAAFDSEMYWGSDADGVPMGMLVPGTSFVPPPPGPDGVRPPTDETRGGRIGAHFASLAKSADLMINCIGPGDPSVVPVREIGYGKSGKKSVASPEGTPYELVAGDMFGTEAKLERVIERIRLPDANGLPPMVSGLPRFIVINYMLPDYAPALFGGPTDGPGRGLVAYFRLRADYDFEAPGNQKSLALMRRFVDDGREPDGSPTRDRFKLIARALNISSWTRIAKISKPETTLISKYNGKPLLTRPQHSIWRGEDFLEVDLDIHTWNFLVRKMLRTMIGRLNRMDSCQAFVVQGNGDDQLPEAVLCASRMTGMDLINPARPAPADPADAGLVTPDAVARAKLDLTRESLDMAQRGMRRAYFGEGRDGWVEDDAALGNFDDDDDAGAEGEGPNVGGKRRRWRRGHPSSGERKRVRRRRRRTGAGGKGCPEGDDGDETMTAGGDAGAVAPTTGWRANILWGARIALTPVRFVLVTPMSRASSWWNSGRSERGSRPATPEAGMSPDELGQSRSSLRASRRAKKRTRRAERGTERRERRAEKRTNRREVRAGRTRLRPLGPGIGAEGVPDLSTEPHSTVEIEISSDTERDFDTDTENSDIRLP